MGESLADGGRHLFFMARNWRVVVTRSGHVTFFHSNARFVRQQKSGGRVLSGIENINNKSMVVSTDDRE